MKKYIILQICIAVLLILLPTNVFADQKSTIQSLNEIDDIKQAVKEYAELNIDEYLPSINFDGSSDSLAINQDAIKTENILKTIVDLIVGEIKQAFGSVTNILIIAILAAVLKIVAQSINGFAASKTARLACMAAVLSFVVLNIKTVIDLASGVIGSSADFMKATLPAMVSLSTASGAITSSSAFSPMVFFACEVITNIICHTILPLFVMGIAFLGIDTLLESSQLKKIGKLFHSVSYWAIGLMMTVFVGIATLKGIVGQTIDGVSVRGVKYAVSTFIPVVGGYLSEAADTILNSMAAMKNICGLAVCIGVIVICALPIIKIFAIGFAYKIVSVLVSAVAGDEFSSFTEDVANSVFGIAAITLCVAIMFLISIAMFVVVGVANV